MSELKPCPFCGSEKVSTLGQTNENVIIVCSDCWASVGDILNGDCPLNENDAIKLWNTREAVD